ncbi:MAG: 2-phosphosulfolactate phosphatase [bacterium]|nr:2-phosphosulfolactate phosphatase [bacterium]
MRKVEVCLTPSLIEQHDLKGKVVVVVDIFRATSCMVSGLASGVKSITPVSEVMECKELMKQGYVGAGERGGKKVDGFDIGNSPFSYMKEEMKGQKVAVTTTNGTLAINKSLEADEVLVGAFLNLSSIADYVLKSNKDLVIHCAGWKGTPNLEDTAFAGALIKKLGSEVELSNDGASMAKALYENYESALYKNLLSSAHAKRLKNFGIEEDLELCCTIDKFNIVPVLKGKELVLA